MKGIPPTSAGSIRRLAAPVLLICLFVPFAVSATTGSTPGSLIAWGGGQAHAPVGLTNVVAVSTAIDHSLALLADGTVTAWGYNFDGQCNVPPGLSQVAAVAAGAFFSVALGGNGSVSG